MEDKKKFLRRLNDRVRSVQDPSHLCIGATLDLASEVENSGLAFEDPHLWSRELPLFVPAAQAQVTSGIAWTDRIEQVFASLARAEDSFAQELQSIAQTELSTLNLPAEEADKMSSLRQTWTDFIKGIHRFGSSRENFSKLIKAEVVESLMRANGEMHDESAFLIHEYEQVRAVSADLFKKVHVKKQQAQKAIDGSQIHEKSSQDFIQKIRRDHELDEAIKTFKAVVEYDDFVKSANSLLSQYRSYF